MERAVRPLPSRLSSRSKATGQPRSIVRVLIIEDNEKFRSILQGCLEPDGWDLALATTPEQALSHFRARPADVVLAEMDLRSGSSIDALKEIRALAGGAQVPVVLMSAFYRPGDEPVRRAIAEIGVKEFVKKPFSVFDLRDQLARLGGIDGGPTPRPAPTSTAPGDDSPRIPA